MFVGHVQSHPPTMRPFAFLAVGPREIYFASSMF